MTVMYTAPANIYDKFDKIQDTALKLSDELHGICAEHGFVEKRRRPWAKAAESIVKQLEKLSKEAEYYSKLRNQKQGG